MIEPVLRNLAHQICLRNGYPEKFDLIVTTDLEPNDCVVIRGGETPIIYVNKVWVLSLMFEAEKKHSPSSQKLAMYPLKDALGRALKVAPKMTRSLSLITVRDAIALRKDAKKWAETLVPQIRDHLRDIFFEVSYEIKVTVKETVTNTTISRNITNPNDIQKSIEDAKVALSRSILENDELAELRDLAERVNDTKHIAVIPASITISVSNNEVKEKMEY
jgi:hypothetical protein